MLVVWCSFFESTYFDAWDVAARLGQAFECNKKKKNMGLRQQPRKQSGNFLRREGEPQLRPLGEGETLSHHSLETTFCCSPKISLPVAAD